MRSGGLFALLVIVVACRGRLPVGAADAGDVGEGEGEGEGGGVDIQLEVEVDPFQDCATLQADGSSSCLIIATLTQIDGNGVRTGAAQFPLTAQVDAVTSIVTKDPILTNGNTAVLAETANGDGLDELVGLRTDDEGLAFFFVISPDFNLQQVVAFRVRAGDESDAETVTIRPFADRSTVTLEAVPSAIGSRGTTEIQVRAVDADGTSADGAVVTVTLPSRSGFVATAAEDLAIDATGEIISVTLDGSGEGSIELTAPTVFRLEEFTIDAEFQALPELGPREEQTTVTVFAPAP